VAELSDPMAAGDKIKEALDEGRILILGAQVLLGFQYRGFFERNFDSLPLAFQGAKTVGLGLLIVGIGLLMWPAAYHRIVERGEDSERLHVFITRAVGWALLPFALVLGLDVAVASVKILGVEASVAAGAAASAVALLFWYGVEILARWWRGAYGGEGAKMQSTGPTAIERKIEHVLTESRVVLPGAQALLGFQLATMLLDGFDHLPDSSKYVHLASLGAIALTTVLLIAPAAYHRIVERGEDTESFHRVASAFVLAAMVPLALGVAGDVFVVVRKLTTSSPVALVVAGATLLFLYGVWFGFTLYRRRRDGAARAGHRPDQASMIRRDAA
jgi:hypothetical protein